MPRRKKRYQRMLLIDPAINSYDYARIAYAQDTFLCQNFGYDIPECDGEIHAGICLKCQAPTTVTPHLYKEELLLFSSSPESLLALVRDIWRDWSLEDIRLLGEILREDDPLLFAQDVIHVYQKRHPFSLVFLKQDVHSIFREAVEEHIQQLAPDTYFIPQCRRERDQEVTYTASLLVGRVAAYQHLSAPTRACGQVDGGNQWIIFVSEHLPRVFAERPAWNSAWQAAWESSLQEMKKVEQQEQAALEGAIARGEFDGEA